MHCYMESWCIRLNKFEYRNRYISEKLPLINKQHIVHLSHKMLKGGDVGGTRAGESSLTFINNATINAVQFVGQHSENVMPKLQLDIDLWQN